MKSDFAFLQQNDILTIKILKPQISALRSAFPMAKVKNKHPSSGACCETPKVEYSGLAELYFSSSLF